MYTLRHFYKPGKKAETKFTTAQDLKDYLDELSGVYDLKEIAHFDEFTTTHTVDLVTDPSAVRRKKEFNNEMSKIDMIPIVPISQVLAAQATLPPTLKLTLPMRPIIQPGQQIRQEPIIPPIISPIKPATQATLPPILKPIPPIKPGEQQIRPISIIPQEPANQATLPPTLKLTPLMRPIIQPGQQIRQEPIIPPIIPPKTTGGNKWF